MNTNTLYIVTISRSILLRLRNVSDKSFRENQRNFMFKHFFCNRAVYEIMWKKNVQPGRPQGTISHHTCALHI
jgi:hypothetical protein